MRPFDAESPLSVRLFGRFEVRLRGRLLPHLRFRKSQAVLACLALRPGQQVERDSLAGLLWPDSAPAPGLHHLRNCLTDLRRALGPEAGRLRSPTPRTLALELTGAFVDVLAFDAALARGDPSGLGEAVAHYRGPLLEGCAEEWAFQEREAREQGYLGALEKLAALALARGDRAEAERHLRLAVAADPLREQTQRALMELFAAGGNYAAALLAYRELRLRLHRELNAEPDPETKALFQRLREEARARAEGGGSPRSAGSLLASATPPGAGEAKAPYPPAAAAAAAPGQTPFPPNLPLHLTSFIGRQDEMAQIQQQLAAHRLVTLTGAGGCGKTRLALEVASGLLATYPDGVWFVDLAPLADPALVSQTVAAVLGVRERPDCPISQSLVEALKPKQLLLLLDNCEHLVGACAALAETLLQACAHLRILSTSREPLGTQGEWPYRVPSLSLPPTVESGKLRVESPTETGPSDLSTLNAQLSTLLQFEAIRLFVERAAAAQPAFAVTAENAPIVAQICRRLDGIPLAIELAAARLKALPLETLHARLDDMFGLLAGGRRTALPRQQTLRATLDWSYDLLTPPEQALLRRLSVFAGGCTLEAVEAVCGGVQVFGHSGIQVDKDEPAIDFADSEHLNTRTPEHPDGVLDLLTRLVEKSLLIYEEQEGEGRYRLLEMIREYARERLEARGEAAPLRQGHLQFFLELVGTAQRHLAGPEAGRCLDRLECEHDNLRAALAWSVQTVDKGPRTVGSGVKDSESELSTAHCPLFTPAELGLQLAGRLVDFWDWRGYHREARDQFLRLLAHPGAAQPTVGRAMALRGAGCFAQCLGDLPAARALLEECLAVWRHLNVPVQIAGALHNLGGMLSFYGDRATARTLLQESLAIFREQGDLAEIAKPLTALASLARQEGDMAAARALAQESVAIAREVGDRTTAAISLHTLGDLALAQGDLENARSLFGDCLAIHRERGDQMGIAHSLTALANLARQEGDMAATRALAQESLAIARALGDRGTAALSLYTLGDLALAQADLENARPLFEECLAIHREQGDRVRIAHSLTALARLAYRAGNLETARTMAEESLAIGREVDHQDVVVDALEALGWVTYLRWELPTARARYEECLMIHRQRGDQSGCARLLNSLAIVARRERNLPAARALSEESLAIQCERDDRDGIAWALVTLGGLAFDQGDLSTARAFFEQTLASRRELGDQHGIAILLNHLAEVNRQEWDIPAARALVDEALRIRRHRGDPLQIAGSLLTAGWISAEEGDFSAGRAQHEEALAIMRGREDRDGTIRALDGVGSLALWQGDLETARALFEEALAAARELNQKPQIAWAIRQLGGLTEAQGEYPAAAALLDQALKLWRELDEPSRLMGTLFLQGWTLRRQGDFASASAAFSELLALAREQRWSGSVVTPLCLLGEVAGDQSDWEGAAGHHAEGLRQCCAGEGRHPQALPQCLNGMARAALARERPARAARLLGAAAAFWTEGGPSGWEIEPRARRDRDRNIAAARAELEEAEFAAAWAEGQAMSIAEAIAEALLEAPAT